MRPDEIEHFLVIYDPATRKTTVKSFGTDYDAARAAYGEAEQGPWPGYHASGGSAKINDTAGQLVSPVNDLRVSGEQIDSSSCSQGHGEAVRQGDWVFCLHACHRSHCGDSW